MGKNEIVKYHNDMNKVNLNGYSEKEMNMFFTLIFLAKEQSSNKLSIPFSELKELADGDKNQDRFINTLLNVNKKLIKLNHQIEIDNKIHIFTLFNIFTVDKTKKELSFQINEMFQYMLNELIGNFTKFDLIEFVNLKSSYSKNMFKLLKQWESKKERKFEIEEFRHLLAIPEKYRMSIIDLKVLNPIMTELPRYFPKLKLEKIKTGRKVTELKFTWNFKKENIDIEETQEEIKISEKLNKAIEKAKKNRFIANLFTDENIEKLISKFEEPALIKGLNACYKDIQKDVKSLNYLIKAIETAAGKKTKKIVVEKEKTDQEKSKSISKEKVPTVQKIKVLESELKKAYKHYLIKNKLSDNPFTKKAFTMNYEIVEKIELSEKLKKLIKENSITEEDIIDGISAGYEREDVIEILADDRSYKPSPDELQKEYEEFLAWKKWNEERTNKK